MAYEADHHTPQKTPFLALPAELRNKIYSYIYHRASPIRIYFYQDPESNTPKPVVPFASNTTIPTRFFLTCRQINAEASSIFYSTNTFLLNRQSIYTTFVRPCFISALLKFFDIVSSTAGLVRSVVFDTFTLCNSAFLRAYVDGKTRVFDQGMDIVEVTVLLRKVWDLSLDFRLKLVDVEYMEQDRAEYWMQNPERECDNRVMEILNSFMDGQLGIQKYGNAVRAVAVRRDGSGGLISWAGSPDNSSDAGSSRFHAYTTVEFSAKDGGKQLELAPLGPL